MKQKSKSLLIFSILICLLTNVVVLLNIPYLRQFFGFIFLLLLPGYLILKLLDIKGNHLEEFLLSWGLSISFILLFGLSLNTLLLDMDYQKPLATNYILVSFSSAYIIILVTKVIRDNSNNDHTKNTKREVIIPRLNYFEIKSIMASFLLPAFSLLGIHLMNMYNNNSIIFLTIFLISIYVYIACRYKEEDIKRIYPFLIYFISISIILLIPLRSNHLIGVDVHAEYYFFQTTLNNLHWMPFADSTLDSSLSISLLPTIFQSLLNVPSEMLYRILYPILFSVSPLIVYAISQKYISETYSFLTSCLYMFQSQFLWTEANPRTCVAILFFALSIMTLFSKNITQLNKKILVIIFIASCIMSHYTTSYIFFVMIGISYIALNIISIKYNIQKPFSKNIVVLFIVLIIFWYSMITGRAFYSAVHFVNQILLNFHNFLEASARDATVMSVLGSGIGEKQIPHKIEFIFTWLIFITTGIGLAITIKDYKSFIHLRQISIKADIIKEKFEVAYVIIAVICAGLLTMMISLPYISKGYDIQRLYLMLNIILSIFSIIGAAYVSNRIKVKPYVMILMILLPYLLCITGITYNVFDVQRSIILNSKGEQYDIYYIHDQENAGAKWLKKYAQANITAYSDFYGKYILLSQATYPLDLIDNNAILNNRHTDGYLVLYNLNIEKSSLYDRNRKSYNLTEYKQFITSNLIYNNNHSEVYK